MAFPRDYILKVLKDAGHEPARSDGKGDSYWFSCVFHNENTPSMHVKAGDANVFKCFACPASGGVVVLADHLGVEIEGRRKRKDGPDPDSWKQYAEALWTEDGVEALKLLRGRGFTDETLRRFKIGVTYQLLSYERGSDFRITIPIFDQHSTFVGCRRYHPKGSTWIPTRIDLKEDPSETTIPTSKGSHTYQGTCPGCSNTFELRKQMVGRPYTCGSCNRDLLIHPTPAKMLGDPGMKAQLYGAQKLADLSRDGTDEERTVIIAEGEWDRLMLEQHGFTAVSGTAGANTWLTEWAQLFDNLNVVLLYDNDKPGIKGQQKVLRSLQDRGACSSLRTPEWTFPKNSPWKDVCDWFGPAQRNQEALQELIDEATSLSTGAREARARAEREENQQSSAEQLILDVRSQRGATHEKRHRIMLIAMKDMLERGRFIRTEGKDFYYFHTDTRRLYRLFDTYFEGFIFDHYRLNQIEAEYKYLENALTTHTANRGQLVEVQATGCYAKDQNQHYVSQYNGSMIRISRAGTEIVANGTDNIFFVEDHSRMHQWNLLDEEPLSDAVSFVKQYITDVTFDLESKVHPDIQKDQFLLYMISMFFGTVMDTKPLVLFLGPHGAGKSFAFKRLLKLLFRPSADVTSIGNEDQDAFEAAVINTMFVVFDNMDSPSPWLADSLAKVATGMEITKRKLYTTLDKQTFTPKCFVGLTSRTPRFTRPDVVDRMLILRVSRRNEKGFKSEYKMRPSQHDRDRFYTSICRIIRSVLGSIDEGGWPDVSSQRMADWITILWAIARGLGWSDDYTQYVLDKMDTQRADFLSQEAEMVSAIERWLLEDQTRYGKPYTTQELVTELNALQEKYREKYRYHFRHFAKQIREILPALRRKWDVNISTIGKAKHTVTHYTFDRLPEDTEEEAPPPPKMAGEDAAGQRELSLDTQEADESLPGGHEDHGETADEAESKTAEKDLSPAERARRLRKREF